MTDRVEEWYLKHHVVISFPSCFYKYYISHINCTRGGYAFCAEGPNCSECTIKIPEHLVIQRDLLNGK